MFAMSQKIKGRVKEQMEKLQKRHYLAEQMRAIKKEMGEDSESGEYAELEKRIRKKKTAQRGGRGRSTGVGKTQDDGAHVLGSHGRQKLYRLDDFIAVVPEKPSQK